MYKKYEMEIVSFSEHDINFGACLSDGGCLDSTTCTSQACQESSFISLFGDC